MNTSNTYVLEKIQQRFADAVLSVHEFRDELTIVVKKEAIVELCHYLKNDDDLSYTLLADLCGIDMATAEKRFGVIYNLYSYKTKHRFRIKVFTEADDPHVPSVTGVWKTANWHERETYDMYGIIFDGHPDLRRFYMPEEFKYHPLRKDFPLMGIPGSLELPKK